MNPTWNNDLELSLIECFQAEPILWQSKHKDHRNKNKVHDAWTRISAILNIPVAEVKKKKESLMSSYRSYRKRVKDSIHSGASSSDIYKPIWFAYETMNSFLGDDAQCKNTTNTDRSSSVINEEEESFDATVDDSQSTSATIEDGQSTRATLEDGQSTRATIEDGQSDLSMRPPTVRRRNKPIELVAAGETVKDALVTLKETIKRRQIHDDDECDLHGKVIAKKLRKLPEEERMQFVCEIYNMFLRHEQRTSASFSSFSLASPTPSATYQRPHTSHSSYSEPSMHHHLSQTRANSEPSTSHYQRAHSSYSSYSEPSVYLSPPQIHIPDQNPTRAASHIIITSNERIRPVTQEYINNVENPIDAAFNNA